MLNALEKKPFQTSLQGDRIRLTRYSPNYTSQVWEYIQRDHKLGGTNYAWVESEQDVAKHITTEPNPDANGMDYLILLDERAIGSIHIHTVNYVDHKTEVGYGIEKGQEGKGYVSEALKLVEAELKRVGFNKMIIICNSDNVRSVRVAERAGFRHEGTLLQDCIENGVFRDSMLFGKLLR